MKYFREMNTMILLVSLALTYNYKVKSHNDLLVDYLHTNLSYSARIDSGCWSR